MPETVTSMPDREPCARAAQRRSRDRALVEPTVDVEDAFMPRTHAPTLVGSFVLLALVLGTAGCGASAAPPVVALAIEPASAPTKPTAADADAATDRAASARMSRARQDAARLHMSAELWRTRVNAAACPSLELLRVEPEWNEVLAHVDPWETPYRIVCDDETTYVVSAGPDRREGTEDDIWVPERVVSRGGGH